MGVDSKHLRLLQVYNISTAASNDVIKQLFQYFGRIEEFQVYPIIITANTKQKVAYVRFERESSVVVAQHLTNTVFFDQAIVCVPATSNSIPDEDTALQSSAALGKKVLPPHVINEIKENENGQKMLYTNDPNLNNLGLPPYPPLGANSDSEIVEQTRRTIYVGNIKKDANPEDIIKFFNTIGEVMYLRMASTSELDECTYCYIEFTDQASVPQALQNDGVEFQGQQIRIQHSRVPIVKPQQKTSDQAREEIEEAMRRRDKGERSPRRRTRTPPSPKDRRRTRSPVRRGKDYDRDRNRENDRGREKEREKDKRSERDRENRRDRGDKREYRQDKEKERRDRRDDERNKEKDKNREKEKGRDKERERKDRERSRDSKKTRKNDESYEKKKDKEKSKYKDKERDRKRSRSPKKEKSKSQKERSLSPRNERTRSPKKERSKSPEKKKRKQDVSESVNLKEVKPVRPKVVEPEQISDGSSHQSPDQLETKLREKLLAKQMEKKRRGSDEMDISD